MGHSASTNYTVSEIQLTNIASGSGLPNAVKLYITPNAGYVVGDQDFTIGTWPTSAPNGIPGVLLPTTVTFGNYNSNEPIASVARLTGVAYDPDNIIEVFVYLNSTATITVDTEILIDIDQLSVHTSTSRAIQNCLTSQVQAEGSCPVSYWPSTGNPITPGDIVPPQPYCVGHFIDTIDAAIVTNTSQPSNLTWSNPLGNIPGITLTPNSDNAEVNKYESSLTPNVSTVLFTKTFWTAPNYSFEVNPFYQLNTAASNSGYYTIEETPTDYNVDKTLQLDTNNSNVLFCDTTDVMKGMQVTGSTLVSCAYDPIANPVPGASNCWPAFNTDIRVMDVDHANNRVVMTETNNLSSGDVVNFSTIANTNWGPGFNSGSRCSSKKFTVKFQGNANVACSDNHIIDWAALGSATPLIQGTSPKIISTDFGSNDIDPTGETRILTIAGTLLQSAAFSILIKRDDGYTYDFDTNTFTPSQTSLSTTRVGDDGYYSTGITFPFTKIKKSYNIKITPHTIVDPDHDGTKWLNKSPLVNTTHQFSTTADDGVVLEYNIDQLTYGLVTLSTTASGFVLGGNLAATYESGIGKSNLAITPKTGTITKADGAVLYVTRPPNSLGNGTDEDGYPRGDWVIWENTANATKFESKGFKGVLRASVTGSGTATLTASYSGRITNFPISATAEVYLNLGSTHSSAENSIVSIYPTVPNLSIDMSILNTSIVFNVRAFDTDVNKESKTLSVVTAPSFGTLGSFDGGQIEYTKNSGAVLQQGQEDSFTYKAVVGSLDGGDNNHFGTITIKFT